MKGLITLLGLLGLVGCHTSAIANKDCALKNIPVVSTDPSRNETYAARTMTTEVLFRNEDAPNPAKVFPDPLVTVKNLTTAKSCDIKDGYGIWTSVYLDANERALILNGYSGSSDFLYFYDPKTCHKLAELDVSEKLWEISGDRVRTGQHYCEGDGVSSCRSIQELRLDNRCLPNESKSIAILAAVVSPAQALAGASTPEALAREFYSHVLAQPGIGAGLPSAKEKEFL